MRRRVVLAEATSGLLLAGGLVIAGTAALLGSIVQSAPLWSDRTGVTALMCVFTLPLLIAVTGIVSARRMDQLGTLAATTHAGRRHPAVVVAAAGTLWAVVISAVQSLVPWVVTPPRDHLPWLALLPWLQVVVSLSAAAWVGAALGVWLRGRLGLSLVAATVLLALYGANYLPGRAAVAAPFDAPWFTPWSEPAPGVPLGHSLVAIAALVAAAGVLNAQARIRRSAGVGALALLAVGVLVIVAVSGQPRAQARAMPDGPECVGVGGGTQFCFHPLAAATAEPVIESLTRTRALVGNQWTVPHLFTHYPLTHAGMPADGDVRDVPLSYGADPATHLANAAYAMMPTCADSVAGQQSWDQIHAWMLWRLGLLTPSADSPVVAVTTMSQTQQQAWIGDQLRAGQCH